MAYNHLSIDLETFSNIDIKRAGLYKYVQSSDFQILLFAYSWNGGAVQIVDMAQGEQLPNEIIQALNDKNVIKHAFNASFERYCLSKFFYTSIDQWRCTMMHSLYCGYTTSLADVGEAMKLGRDKRKLGIGMSLIKLFCVPQKPTKTNGFRTRTLPHHEPEKWKLFKQYCSQDVVSEMEVERQLTSFPVPDAEQKLWELDQKINAYGVALDVELIDGALHCSEAITAELMSEAMKISGLNNPKSVAQLKKWLEEEIDEEIVDMKKDTVNDLIKTTDSDLARRMLEIRQKLSKTSVKKYDAMRAAICDDGRLRGLLQYYGANRTGRWAGRLAQVQNLPRNYLSTLDYARQLVKSLSVNLVKFCYGSVPDTLSQLLRTAFIPSLGHTFVVADFSAIEARVIAWLAGEQWRQEVFATHGKIYEASASQMFGVPLELIKKGNPEYSLRQKGKVAELALGYQGGAGALIKMGALDMGLTEEELPDIVRRWRSANKRIRDLWYSVENASLEVMYNGYSVGVRGLVIAREIDSQRGQDFLTIQLPSGRKLFYAKPRLLKNEFGKDAIHYEGMNQTSKKWQIMNTYGGKLVENIVQAIARDCLAVSLTRLDAAGYKIAFHVHDEAILDVPVEYANLEHACEVMGQSIPWAQGLLLRADGYITDYYKKD